MNIWLKRFLTNECALPHFGRFFNSLQIKMTILKFTMMKSEAVRKGVAIRGSHTEGVVRQLQTINIVYGDVNDTVYSAVNI